ncbi:MAG: nitroreductase family protein [Firmicutes bacterium]|nr:nitroreductase family protein [Bacillota bacterium]
MDAVWRRRSIRKYLPDPIPEEVVIDLLRAAMSAPSAGNEQPWQFVVIRERRLLDEVPRFHAHAQMIREAPLAILVCGEAEKAKFEGAYWVQDCAAATENILIAATAKGLGSVWLGVYPVAERMEALRRLLGIPEEIVPFALIPIGRPAEEKPPADRYDPQRVHYDRW